ncbi:MAG: 5-oxoprolinase subunit PxpB [Lachnospiraceae bacterium]|nr:5-oxoprolinase subunit PxpB [Lachnospiraceae bacterium]
MDTINAQYLIAGDCAVAVKFGDEISLEINGKVRMLHEALKNNPVEGVVETVPTYCSLMVHYHPDVIRYKELVSELEDRLSHVGENTVKPKEYIVEVPVWYGGEKGVDLEECAAFEHISVEEFIKIHSQSDYYVYMLGVAPGHPYTARFENPFHFKRRESPRIKIPGNCLVVAGNQSNMIPFEQPCGWNIVGTLPVDVCDYNRKQPFLVQAGEWVRYIPITESEYKDIRKQVLAGTYQCKRYEREVR